MSTYILAKRQIFILFICFAISAGSFSVSPSIAQEEPEEQALKEIPLTPKEAAARPLGGNYESDIEHKWQEILTQKGLIEGENPGYKFISSGKSTIDFSKDRPGWIEARVLAFEIAHIKAKAKMVLLLGKTLDSQTVLDITENVAFTDGQIRKNIILNQVQRILSKTSDFTEATLDKALKSIDPDYETDKYDGVNNEDKAKIAREFFKKKIKVSASKLITGAFNFRVLEGPTASKEAYEILVGLVWTPDLARLAGDIENREYGIEPADIGKHISENLPKTVGEAASAFGSRVFVNEKGNRVVIAYGQAEPRRSEQKDRAIEDAIYAASMRADAALIGFVSDRVTVYSDQTTEKLMEEYSAIVTGERVGRDGIRRIKGFTKKVKLQGIHTLRKWVIEHPENGHKMVVVAKIWSPSGQAMAKKMNAVIEARGKYQTKPYTVIKSKGAITHYPDSAILDGPNNDDSGLN